MVDDNDDGWLGVEKDVQVQWSTLAIPETINRWAFRLCFSRRRDEFFTVDEENISKSAIYEYVSGKWACREFGRDLPVLHFNG